MTASGEAPGIERLVAIGRVLLGDDWAADAEAAKVQTWVGDNCPRCWAVVNGGVHQRHLDWHYRLQVHLDVLGALALRSADWAAGIGQPQDLAALPPPPPMWDEAMAEVEVIEHAAGPP